MDEYMEEEAVSDSVMAKGSAAAAAKDRKKSLMTRLIPGRNAPLGKILEKNLKWFWYLK